MLVAALSTGNKIGLALLGGAFVVFALVSAFLIPRFRPDYPTRRGLPVFLTVSVALFVAMMFGIFFLAREPEESSAEGGSNEPPPPAETSPPPPPTTTAPTTTQTQSSPPPPPATTAPAAPKSVPVTETEFKISLPQESLSPGRYTFDLKNDGQTQHDLVVNGPGVDDEKTPVIDGGETAKLTVELKSGTYEFYCSVPGHKQAGMDVKVNVS